MTVLGGSHTNFDAASFGAGAVTGSAAVAGALVQGARNAAALNAQRWEGWTREQLERAADLSEELRRHQYERAENLQRDNDRLRRVLQRVTVRRAQARRAA